MGNRLSKIYTKTGDDGTTGLGDGSRVAKDSARVTAYGTVDEANSTIGVLLAWLAVFDRQAITASFGVWRTSILAGFLGAFASQFWFIGFSLTSAANVRTLALVEVIFAQAVSAYVFRQPVTARQMLGMAVIMLGIGLLFHSQR